MWKIKNHGLTPQGIVLRIKYANKKPQDVPFDMKRFAYGGLTVEVEGLSAIIYFMETLLNNFNHQSYKSISIVSLVTTVSFYFSLIIEKVVEAAVIESALSFYDFVFYLNSDFFIIFFIKSLTITLGLSLLLSKKGLLQGLSLGILISLIFITPFLIEIITSAESTSSLAWLWFSHISVNNLLPLAISGTLLGILRKD